jgi:hypothetical protein
MDTLNGCSVGGQINYQVRDNLRFVGRLYESADTSIDRDVVTSVNERIRHDH